MKYVKNVLLIFGLSVLVLLMTFTANYNRNDKKINCNLKVAQATDYLCETGTSKWYCRGDWMHDCQCAVHYYTYHVRTSY